MKGFLRLYPASWRKRYGAEMERLVEDLPSNLSVGLDLILGAAAAYAAVIRANRILSTAGAFLHGLCVAVLLESIGFVLVILLTQGSQGNVDVGVGPVHLVSVSHVGIYLLRGESLASLIRVATVWLPGVALLLTLSLALAGVVAAPRFARTVR